MSQYSKTIFPTDIIRFILKLISTDHPAWIIFMHADMQELIVHIHR